MRRPLWSGTGNCEMDFNLHKASASWLKILDFWALPSAAGVTVSSTSSRSFLINAPGGRLWLIFALKEKRCTGQSYQRTRKDWGWHIRDTGRIDGGGDGPRRYRTFLFSLLTMWKCDVGFIKLSLNFATPLMVNKCRKNDLHFWLLSSNKNKLPLNWKQSWLLSELPIRLDIKRRARQWKFARMQL